MHEVLVNRLGGLSLPRKSVVRLTDRPEKTLDVYRGRKQQTTTTSAVWRESSLFTRGPYFLCELKRIKSDCTFVQSDFRLFWSQMLKEKFDVVLGGWYTCMFRSLCDIRDFRLFAAREGITECVY